MVTEVALTPCTSYIEAYGSVEATINRLKARPPSYITDEDSDSDSQHSGYEDIGGSAWVDDIGDDSVLKGDSAEATGANPAVSSAGHKANNSIAEDVISRRGSYGRFAQKWFSRSGWLQDQKRSMGLTGSNKPAETNEEAVVVEPAATTDADSSKAINSSEAPPAAPEDSSASIPSTGSGSADLAGTVPTNADAATSTPETQHDSSAENRAGVSLLPKLLRTTEMFFGASRAFHFSYDYDITRSLSKQPRSRRNNLPLHKLVDNLYFWNRHVIQPFIDIGADSLSLPLMKGFVGQSSFVVDSNPPQTDDGGVKDSVEMSDFSYRPRSGSPLAMSPPTATSLRSSAEFERRASEKVFDVTLISRRSVKRAGLRYLRRGVDEDGNVANAVETEQMLCPSVVNQLAGSQEADTGSSNKTYSFVQIRGSIPLFWTQSPFSLKPVPVIQHSLELNFGALKAHFDRLRREYSSIQVVNLVEKHGVESALGTMFERSVQQYNDEITGGAKESTVPFEWFDFHSACKGMKFENVSLLLGRLSTTIEQLGSTVEETGPDTDGSGATSPASGAESSAGRGLIEKQKGVLRTNCMDCLDRTNVCQSSFAKFMLDAQLKEQGFDMAAQRDQENAWFNTMWADNGDAISKQYASTAAMKGDYTRTRRRDYRGALTDAGLSLTRFFNGYIYDIMNPPFKTPQTRYTNTVIIGL